MFRIVRMGAGTLPSRSYIDKGSGNQWSTQYSATVSCSFPLTFCRTFCHLGCSQHHLTNTQMFSMDHEQGVMVSCSTKISMGTWLGPEELSGQTGIAQTYESELRELLKDSSPQETTGYNAV